MQLAFGPYRLDAASQRLWRDAELVPLTRKAFGVLQCLIERRGGLVAKEEILARVWPDTVVGEAVLKVCVREIRRALGDDAQQPRFIATAHRRGYRFIAPVTQDATPAGIAGGTHAGRAHETRLLDPATIVGRAQPLAELEQAYAAARSGRRQVLFITGEAGIGKTTVVDLFLHDLGRAPDVRIARGACRPQHDTGESYQPLLEALGDLCRSPGGEVLVAELARRAPTWLLQMPALTGEAERARLLAQSLGATPQRMLREMVEMLGAISTETPLVLVLEDLHWSDPATLDLISALARRREPARLLLLVTYRPAEVIVHQHPLRALKLDLQLHGHGSELSLEFLGEDDVRALLAARFGALVASALAPLAYRRSDGNPLFLASIADHLVSSGVVLRDGAGFRLASPDAQLALAVPESLRQMVEKRLEQLPASERAALEAASVAGVEFSSSMVAAALEVDAAAIEDLLAELGSRAELVRACGSEERPDGSIASRLRFVHALYAEVLYDGVAPTRRVRLHHRIAAFEEASYAAAAPQIAALLALHYDRGGDHVRAVAHLRQAAENAARRFAGRAAVDFLTRALQLVPRFAEPERVPLGDALRERRALLRYSMGDLAGAADDLATLATLARAGGRVDVEVRALVHQASIVYLLDPATSATLFARALAASRDLPDPSIAIHLRSLRAYNRLRTHSFRPDDRAACSDAVRTLAAAGERTLLVAHYGRSALFENVAGEYAAARRLAEEGLVLALETGHLFEHLICQYARAWALLHLGAWGEMQRGLGEEIELAERNDHPLWAAAYRLQGAWLLLEAGAYGQAEALSRAAVAVGRAARHALTQSLGLILLAAAQAGAGDATAAQAALREIETRLAADGIVVEPTLRPLLETGRIATALARDALAEARGAAQRLLALAGDVGDRTYQALARRALAEIALRAGSGAAASREIDAALEVLGDAAAPLAAWRVRATAARICVARRRRAQAREHWAASAAVLQRLAATLATDPALRTQLLASPHAREVLAQAG